MADCVVVDDCARAARAPRSVEIRILMRIARDYKRLMARTDDRSELAVEMTGRNSWTLHSLPLTFAVA